MVIEHAVFSRLRRVKRGISKFCVLSDTWKDFHSHQLGLTHDGIITKMKMMTGIRKLT
jgi:hypothetical protein